MLKALPLEKSSRRAESGIRNPCIARKKRAARAGARRLEKGAGDLRSEDTYLLAQLTKLSTDSGQTAVAAT